MSTKIAKATIQTVCFSVLALILGAYWGLSRTGSSFGGGGSPAREVVYAAVPTTDKTVYIVSSGDLRPAANQNCWATQDAMEKKVRAAIEKEGFVVKRAHPFDAAKGHGFIDSQRYGMQVFESIPPTARLVVAESVWQYSHHVLAGLRSHAGPILTLANFEGKWPGLVGLLNLNGGLVKAGVGFSTLWSVDFSDEYFVKGLKIWLQTGRLTHDVSHVRPYVPPAPSATSKADAGIIRSIVDEIRRKKIILGVFDEGCMGMYNAIIDDELMNPMGFYKERLSQSALYAAMQTVTDAEAQGVYQWLVDRGMTFHTGTTETRDLTVPQIIEQCKMYVATVRIAHTFGCDAVGIQYQQGLKDLTAASDLVEGVLNNVERPPVWSDASGSGKPLFDGLAVPHFNEVDEGSAIDSVITNRVWLALGLDPATTLHDLRWGEHYKSADGKVNDFVWVFEISGAVPPSHFAGGYKSAHGYRQPPMYFPRGGSTVQGTSKPGQIVWSRVYVMGGELHADLGRASVVELPAAEVQRRLDATTYVRRCRFHTRCDVI